MKEMRKDITTGHWVIFNSQLRERLVEFWKDRNYGQPKLPTCSFCSGSEAETPPETASFRSNGTPPDRPGWWVRSFRNHGSVLDTEEELDRRAMGMYDVTSGFGIHEIIVETPDHVTQLEELPAGQVRDVLWFYRERIAAVKQAAPYKYVIVFKNFGLGTVGSMEHSHAQLFAAPVTPTKVKDELNQARRYYADKERCLYCDVIRLEHRNRERLVFETDRFVVLCPFSSMSPYEMMILPKAHEPFYEEMSPETANDLAAVLVRTQRLLARCLGTPPYTFVIHTGPNVRPRPGYWSSIREDYHWHIEIAPRLFRITGLEWGTGLYFNPIFPETAADELRSAGAEEATHGV